MSETRESGPEDELDGVDLEEAIGIYKYTVSGEESEVDLKRHAVWTPDGWTKTSNAGMVGIAPEEKTLEAFKDAYHGSQMRVAHPADVEGEVVVGDPTVTIEDMGLDVDVLE